MDYYFFNMASGAIFIFILILLVIGAITYILSSLGLMKLAQREGHEMAWLAWIPIGNLYILGKLIGTLPFNGKNYDQPELILPGAWFASLVLSRLPFVGGLATFALCILSLYAFYLLVKLYAPSKATLYTVIAILAPGLGASIILFSLRNKPRVQSPA